MESFPSSTPAYNAGCLNCGGPRYGAYCHLCGQHYLEGPPTVGGIITEFLTRSLSLERGLLHTFVGLSVRPGRIIREYLLGRRQRIIHPVGYLMLSAGLSVAVWPLRERSYLAQAARGASGDALWDRTFLYVTSAIAVHPIIVVLLVCGFFVPLQRLLFAGRITFAESFVYTLFLGGHAIMLESLLTPLVALLTTHADSVLDDASTLITLYLFAAAAGGYFGFRLSTLLKTLVAVVGAVLGLTLVMMTAAGAVYLVLLIRQGSPG
jgi:hypothetical protein